MRRDKNLVAAVRDAHALLGLLANPNPVVQKARQRLKRSMTQREQRESLELTLKLAAGMVSKGREST